jgi:hypothetical protein
MEDIKTLADFFVWLSGPGSVIAAGFFISYIFERFDFWHKWNHDAKTAIFLGLSVVIAYVAKFLQVEILVENEQLNFIFTYFLNYFSGQLAYKKYFDVRLAASSQVKK